MENKSKISKIDRILKKNGFYDYLEHQDELSKKVRAEFNKARSARNPRNIEFSHSWKEINSYGHNRNLLLIELGGTYIKLFKISIKNNRVKLLKKSPKAKFYENIVYTPELLFEKIHFHLEMFLTTAEQKSLSNCLFIFTFPLNQLKRKDGIIDGVCTNFAKQHKSKDIVGLQVGLELEKYLNKNGYPKIKVAVTNDSPPSLLAAKKIEIDNPKEKFDALINIIVGTGSNIAVGYHLPNGNFFISNTEFGMFKSFPRSIYDKRMDAKTDSKGTYLCEKMFSGAWRHLVFKEIYKSLVKRKVIDCHDYDDYNILDAESIDLDELLNRPIRKKNNLYILKHIWDEISYRGGYICGFTLAQIITTLKADYPDMEFGVVEVGGVLEHSVIFHNTMIETMNHFLELALCKTDTPNRIEINFFNPKLQTVYGSTIFDAFLH